MGTSVILHVLFRHPRSFRPHWEHQEQCHTCLPLFTCSDCVYLFIYFILLHLFHHFSLIFVLPPWRSKLCSWMISSCESFERVYCWYFRLCRAADPGSPKNILFWKVAWILNEILASDFPPGSIFSVRLDMLLPPPPLKIDLFSHVFSSEKIGAEILREQLVEQKAWMSRMVAISVCVVAGTWHRCARWDLGSSANLFPNKLSWLLLLLWQNIWVYGDLVQMGQTEVKMPLEIQWKLTHTVCLPLELESLICLEDIFETSHTHTHR